MQNCPFVSVCFTCYNQRKYVRQALLSVLEQTYSNMELVICDDASSDGTSEIVSQIIKQYNQSEKKRFSIIYDRADRNHGVVANVSRCFRMAKGELLIQAHDDDISKKDRVEKIVAAWVAADKKPTAIIHGWDVIDGDNKLIASQAPWGCNAERSLLWLKDSWPHGAASAYSPRVVTEFPPMEVLDAFEDVSYFYRAKILGNPLYIDDRLLYYRVGSGCTSTSRTGIRRPQITKGIKGYAAIKQAYKDLEFVKGRFSDRWSEDVREAVDDQSQQFKDVYECFGTSSMLKRWHKLVFARNLMLSNMPPRMYLAPILAMPWFLADPLSTLLIRWWFKRRIKMYSLRVSDKPPFDLKPL